MFLRQTRAARKRLLGLLLLANVWLISAAAAAPTPHLRAGADHFRAGRYEAALVEFRVSEALGESAAASWYSAAALAQLGREEEALEKFEASLEKAPGGRRAVLDYYWALSCHALKLYVCADERLARVSERTGPRISRHAAALRERLEPVLQQKPSSETIGWYQAQAARAEAAGRTRLAEAYRREARALIERTSSAALRPDVGESATQ